MRLDIVGVKVKICGITNLGDARVAIDCGADFLGFNFYEKSPRYIYPDSAAEIIAKLPLAIIKVGVFVDPNVSEIEGTLSLLDRVQLHGDETPEFVEQLTKTTGAKVIKALRVRVPFDPASALQYDVDGYLLDSFTKEFGGSGQSFDWDAALEFKKVVPDFYLAGGLTPDNVADAIRMVRPYAVDVSSGVEATKRNKDHKKVEAFIRAAKKAL